MSSLGEAAAEMPKNDINASKAELERKIRQRVACEERAHRIVEKLLEGPITDHYLTECGQYITPSHYEDIVEERAIIGQCGYPVCGNRLQKIPQQKYFISTKSNKVYDITERKNFCSNQCFKASKYFECQISTTPVWLRETEKPETLRVLDLSKNVGSPGLEVVGKKHVSALEKEVEILNKEATTESRGSNLASDTVQTSVPFSSGNIPEDKSKSKFFSESESSEEKLSEQVSSNLQIRDSVRVNDEDSKIYNKKDTSSLETLAEVQKPHSTTEKSAQKTAVSKTEYLMQLLNKRQNLLSKMVDDQPGQEMREKLPRNRQPEKTNVTAEQGQDFSAEPSKFSVLEKNTKTLSETLDTNSRMKLKTENMADIDTTSTKHDVSRSSFLENFQRNFPNLSPQMLVICARLFDWLTQDSLKYLKLIKDDHLDRKPDEKETENLTTSSGVEQDKVAQKDELIKEKEIATGAENAPDFHTIREQSQNFQIKVREFYKGSYTYKPPQGSDSQEPGQADDTSEIFLPPVDSMAQNTLRRKIVLQKLEKSIPEMLTPLGLAIQHIVSDLRHLVATFSLTSTNILLKPAEWSLVSLFLIKMLSLCVPVVWKSFNEGRSLHFFKVFLSALGASLEDVDKILSHIYSEKIQEHKI